MSEARGRPSRGVRTCSCLHGLRRVCDVCAIRHHLPFRWSNDLSIYPALSHLVSAALSRDMSECLASVSNHDVPVGTSDINRVFPLFYATWMQHTSPPLPRSERLHWAIGTTTINIPRVPAREEDHVGVLHGQVGELFLIFKKMIFVALWDKPRQNVGVEAVLWLIQISRDLGFSPTGI